MAQVDTATGTLMLRGWVPVVSSATGGTVRSVFVLLAGVIVLSACEPKSQPFPLLVTVVSQAEVQVDVPLCAGDGPDVLGVYAEGTQKEGSLVVANPAVSASASSVSFELSARAIREGAITDLAVRRSEPWPAAITRLGDFGEFVAWVDRNHSSLLLSDAVALKPGTYVFLGDQITPVAADYSVQDILDKSCPWVYNGAS